MLYSLAGIAPPGVRRQVACSVEKHKQENDPRHPLYGYEMSSARLKSRKSFLRSTSATDNDPRLARQQLWDVKCPAPPEFIKASETLPPGYQLQWPTWKSLNRLRTQVGRCRESMAKWGFRERTQLHCDCGASSQTMAHLLSCPLCPSSYTREDLNEASDNAVAVAKFWADKIQKIWNIDSKKKKIKLRF